MIVYILMVRQVGARNQTVRRIIKSSLSAVLEPVAERQGQLGMEIVHYLRVWSTKDSKVMTFAIPKMVATLITNL